MDNVVQEYQIGLQTKDINTIHIFAGEGVSLIHSIESAQNIVKAIGEEAEECLSRGQQFVYKG